MNRLTPSQGDFEKTGTQISVLPLASILLLKTSKTKCCRSVVRWCILLKIRVFPKKLLNQRSKAPKLAVGHVAGSQGRNEDALILFRNLNPDLRNPSSYLIKRCFKNPGPESLSSCSNNHSPLISQEILAQKIQQLKPK